MTGRFDDGIQELTPAEWAEQKAEFDAKLAELPFFGQKRRDAIHAEIVRNHAIAKRRRYLDRCHPVRCVETGEIFIGIHAAARAVGCWPNAIVSVLDKPNVVAKGMHWENV